MTDNQNNNPQPLKERLSGITVPMRDGFSHGHEKYTRIVKSIQFVLPLIALVLILLILNWNRFKIEAVTPIQEKAQEIATASIGKNELINPRFESVDDKNQPFTLIADSAVQSEDNQNLVLLDEPSGELKLKSGKTVTIQAKNGAYTQDTQHLLLRDTVELFFDQAYQMNTQELHINMQTRKAWSDVDVSGEGPEGTLQAKGMKAQSADDSIIFTGPAKLVLLTENNALGLSGLPGGRLPQ